MKPHVICLMASSVDGRTLLVVGVLRRRAGTRSSATMTNSSATHGSSAASPAGVRQGQAVSRRRMRPFRASPGSRHAKHMAMVLCSMRRQDRLGPFGHRWRSDCCRSVRGISDAHLAGLRGDGVSYIFTGKSELDLALALDILNRELGVRRLLLEETRRCQRCISALGTDRRAEFDPLMRRPIAEPPSLR
jgi:hypothetical protein